MTDGTVPEEHWNVVYAAPEHDLGWYEPEPSTLALVTEHSSRHQSVIDVGGGDSRLVDRLLDLGYEDITVLDLSPVALDRARQRLGSKARSVTWVQSDVTSFEPDRRWELWHDRAVFHFLVDAYRRDAYRAVLRSALAPRSVFVVAAFSPAGPARCAGLPVAHYDTSSLAAEFASDFDPISLGEVVPRSGEGDQRPYVAGVFARRP